jgi:hypothetical protein
MFIEAQWEKPRHPTQRKTRRASMSLPALILLFGQRHSAQLHNLSCGGAMIQSTAPVRTRDQIVLSCGTIEARGGVIWVRDGCFGVEFHKPIEEDQILRQLSRSVAILNRRELRDGAKTQ